MILATLPNNITYIYVDFCILFYFTGLYICLYTITHTVLIRVAFVYWKYTHNLKGEVMLYSMVIFRTSSLGYSISSNPERSGPWKLGVGREVRLYRSLQEGAGSPNIKRLLLIKEVQISQIKELSDFICMGRCKSFGSLKSFLLYVS